MEKLVFLQEGGPVSSVSPAPEAAAAAVICQSPAPVASIRLDLTPGPRGVASPNRWDGFIVIFVIL